MPWKVEKVETQRGRFVLKALEPGANISELCREAGITRPTGYYWIERYKQRGIAGLSDIPRRPHRFRDATSADVVMEAVSIRTNHPTWAGRKIRKILLRKKILKKVPSARTIDRILKRCGLVNARITRRRWSLPEVDVITPTEANQVWTIDFKGWWYTKDGTRCEPLTIRDEHSKFIIGIFALEHTTIEAVKACLIKCFRWYGLPHYIRSDNGHPFINAQSLAGLTRLSLWWLKLGIMPNRIAPASPFMNPGHERMHKDIKAELQINPAQSNKAEQERFNHWRHEYNTIRPHQSLNDDVPAEHYSRSKRQYRETKGIFAYPIAFHVRKVSRNGEISWSGRMIGISKALAREYVGIEIIDKSTSRLWYMDYCLGVSDACLKTPIVSVKEPLHKCRVPKVA